MSVARVSIELDSDVARAYAKAPPEEKKKLQSLLSIWLRQAAIASPSSLPTLMDEISDTAQQRGLTPEILESLLNAH